jgi:hypothetical protein
MDFFTFLGVGNLMLSLMTTCVVDTDGKSIVGIVDSGGAP